MEKKVFSLGKLLVVVFSFLNIAYGFAQCGSCEKPGWIYVKEVTIDNTPISTSNNNFQELITVDTQTPISQGKMDITGKDIRFVDDDCATSLCYWIESGINTSSTKIWVMLPTLAANSIKTFFMFYGNPAALDASSFSCVFPNILTVTGAVTLSGNQNYDWIDIQGGSNISVGAGQILSFNARKITFAGTINGNGKGYGPGSGPGGGGDGGGSDGGGGGGYGGKGGSGKCPGGGSGPVNGTLNGIDIDMGSGGGGSDCGPLAAGGGAVKFKAAFINISGDISVNGADAGGTCNEEAAGGGSGGGILIYGKEIIGNGSLKAQGGDGQASDNKEGGAGGGGGRVKLIYCESNSFSGAINVSKGTPGSGPQCSASDAEVGTSSVNTYICETITLGIEKFAIVANAGNDISYCSGSSITIGDDSLSDHIYSWTPSTGLSSNSLSDPIVLISNSGSSNIVSEFILTVTAGGHVCKDTVEVTVFPLPTSVFSATGPICVSEALLITYTGNASLAGTYVWDFNGGTVLSGSGQGPYSVSWPVSGTKTITLTVIENGCISSATNMVTTVNPPDANAGADISICSAETGVLGANPTAGFSYVWSPASNLSSATVANPSVTVTNFTGNPINITYYITASFASCTATDTVVVTINPGPISNAGADTISCSGNTAIIGAANNIDYTYTWSPALGLSSTTVSNPGLTLSNSNVAPSLHTYYVTTELTASGCTSEDTINIVVAQIPTSSFTLVDSACVQEITAISYTGNATAGANYFWDFDGGTASPGIGQGPHNLNWLNSGIKVVSLSVSENTCNSTTVFDTIVIKPTPLSNAGPNVAVCSGDSVGIGSIAILGYSYSWSPTLGLNNPNTVNPIVSLANPIPTPLISPYFVTTTSLGCSSTDTLLVTVFPLPVVNFGFSNVCLNESMSFNDLSLDYNWPIASWEWTFGDTSNIVNNNQNTTHLYTIAGSYNTKLVVFSSFGCSDSISKIVTVNPNPLVDFTVDDSLGCEEFCVVFEDLSTILSGNNATFQWNFGDGTSSETPLHCYTNDSVFAAIKFDITLTTTSDSGCVASLLKPAFITVYPNPEANFLALPNKTSIVNSEISTTDFSIGTDFWNWNFGDNSPPFIFSLDSSLFYSPPPHGYLDTGVYTITLLVTNKFGCLDTSFQTVIIEPDFVFYIPNSFSPNGDDKNETFSGEGLFIKEYQMDIFDRWGKLIFKTNDINQPWDGKAIKGGEPLMQDVYVYSIIIKDFKNEEHSYHGIINLIR